MTINVTNDIMNKAKNYPDNEFYTLYSDVKAKLTEYRDQFRNKSVHCPCDLPHSNFYKFLKDEFRNFGLRHLHATGIDLHGNGTYASFDGSNETIASINGNFTSWDVNKIMEQCDIVCTNPPFELMTPFIQTITDFGVEFLIISPIFAGYYKYIFPLIAAGKISLTGVVKEFERPDGTIEILGNTVWFTTFPVRSAPELPLTEKYDPDKYPQYDNYPAISVDSVDKIPMDFEGEIGIPITFFNKWNRNQFAIVGVDYDLVAKGAMYLNGRRKFQRIIIKKRLSEAVPATMPEIISARLFQED